MTHNWQHLGAVAPGGTVLKIAGDGEQRLWLASPAGLFTRNGAGWRAVMRGIPFWRVNSLVAADNTVVVAGLPGGLIRSANNGRSWQSCIIEQTEAPVLTLAISPRFQSDRLIFAGTDGDGILRSTDGGRRWQLANFGLRDFAILELVTAPVWDQREYLFALSEQAVYQSPNAGRAWRRAELPADAGLPSALAVSPNFAIDQTVYLGCEDGRLLVSTDAGRSYTPLQHKHTLPPINAMLFDNEGSLLLGTMGGMAKLAPPESEARPIAAMDQPVITLSAAGEAIYAGRIDSLYQAGHEQWQRVESLSARRFVWYLTPNATHWAAAGPEEGLFVTTDAGRSWDCVWSETPLLAAAAATTHLWQSTPAGVGLSTDWGRSWQTVWSGDDLCVALAANDANAWCGTQSGALWRFSNKESEQLETPFSQGRILGLYSDGPIIVVAFWSQLHKEMQIWRGDDRTGTWQNWLSRVSKPLRPQVAFAGDAILVGLETAFYKCDGASAGRHNVTTPAAPVSAIAATEPPLLAVTDRLVEVGEHGAIEEHSSAMDGSSIIYLTRLSDSQLMAATSDGQIFLTAKGN